MMSFPPLRSASTTHELRMSPTSLTNTDANPSSKSDTLNDNNSNEHNGDKITKHNTHSPIHYSFFPLHRSHTHPNCILSSASHSIHSLFLSRHHSAPNNQIFPDNSNNNDDHGDANPQPQLQPRLSYNQTHDRPLLVLAGLSELAVPGPSSPDPAKWNASVSKGQGQGKSETEPETNAHGPRLRPRLEDIRSHPLPPRPRSHATGARTTTTGAGSSSHDRSLSMPGSGSLSSRLLVPAPSSDALRPRTWTWTSGIDYDHDHNRNHDRDHDHNMSYTNQTGRMGDQIRTGSGMELGPGAKARARARIRPARRWWD